MIRTVIWISTFLSHKLSRFQYFPTIFSHKSYAFITSNEVTSANKNCIKITKMYSNITFLLLILNVEWIFNKTMSFILPVGIFKILKFFDFSPIGKFSLIFQWKPCMIVLADSNTEAEGHWCVQSVPIYKCQGGCTPIKRKIPVFSTFPPCFFWL